MPNPRTCQPALEHACDMRKVGFTKATEDSKTTCCIPKIQRISQVVGFRMFQPPCDIMGIIVPASWVCLTMAVRISTTKVQANTHNQAMPVMILNGQWFIHVFTCSNKFHKRWSLSVHESLSSFEEFWDKHSHQKKNYLDHQAVYYKRFYTHHKLLHLS